MSFLCLITGFEAFEERCSGFVCCVLFKLYREQNEQISHDLGIFSISVPCFFQVSSFLIAYLCSSFANFPKNDFRTTCVSMPFQLAFLIGDGTLENHRFCLILTQKTTRRLFRKIRKLDVLNQQTLIHNVKPRLAHF